MPVPPGAFAACYAALWVGNDLADHVIQTDEQARAKALRGGPVYWAGAMLGHLTGVVVAQGAALAALRLAGVRLSPGRVALALALSAGTHGVLDRRRPVIRLLEATGSAKFAAPVVRTHVAVDGYGRICDARGGVPHDAETTGVLPLHGLHLADQTLHHVVCFVAALILAGGGR